MSSVHMAGRLGRAGARLDPHAVSRAVTLGEQLAGAWGSWGPSMTRDAQQVAFISDRRGRPELWVQDLVLDGEPPPATPLPLSAWSDDPVVAVRWSADGAWLACALATDGGVRTEVWVVRPDGSDARRVAGGAGQHAELGPWTRRGHRLTVTFPATRTDGARAMLVDPLTGETEPLAAGGLIHVLDLSADAQLVLVEDGPRGHEFCVVVDREHDVHHPLLPYPSIGATVASLLRPAPPGEQHLVAYLATDAGLPRRALVAMPLGPGGWRGQGGVLAAREDAELEGLDADDAGRLLLLVWNVAGRSELELLDTRTDERIPLPGLPGQVASSPVLSRDGSSVVLAVEGPTRPRELWHVDTATQVWTRLTDAPALPEVPLVVPSLETFTAADGLTLTGWLYPARRDDGRPGPAVVSLHGGPEAQERPSFNPQHQALAAAGIAVFAPNIRGSSGFGRRFSHADDLYGRFDAFDDVFAAADYLVERGIADPAQLAVAGRSYGGYLTLASLAFRPGVFAAGVDICGMSDLLTFYRDTEPWIGAAAVTKYGDPQRHRQLLVDISPLRQVDRIDVPLLVVHGEHDTNVPVGEARQLVDALRRLGRPVEYLQLDGEGHEFRSACARARLVGAVVRFLAAALDAPTASQLPA